MMKIESIRIVGSSLAYVTCMVDGRACDAHIESGEPVVRATAHPSPVVLRGAQVPAEIVSALVEAGARTKSQGLTEEELHNPPPGVVTRQPREELTDPHFFSRE
jgi:hypothetical protein